MQTVRKSTIVGLALVSATVALGCEEEKKPAPAPARSAKLEQAVATPPSAAAPAPTPTPAPAPTAPAIECPKGSSGEGTFDKPCEAKGSARMMEVTWTGKMDDKGPTFRVINKAPSTILYGKIAVYFYDKAGKQIQLPDPTPGSSKTRPYHTCSGNLFAGVMKPAEKAVLTFSCVKKSHVPDGATAMEAEMQTVGFADASEKKSDSYWRNSELTPDERKKGGNKVK